MAQDATARAGVLYSGEFDGFDPMTVEVQPGALANELTRVVRRARDCLHGRTAAQLIAIAELSDHLLTLDVLAGRITAQRHDGTDEQITIDTIKSVDERGLLNTICTNVARMCDKNNGPLDIKAHCENRNLIEIESLTPGEMFAVHSLVQCMRASDMIAAHYLVQPTEHDQFDCLTAAFVHVVIAAECITMAELETEYSQRFFESRRAVLKDSGRIAADARWVALGPIRARAVALYKGRTWKSRAQAVKAMKEEILRLAKEAGYSLKEDNAERTITSWLKGI